MNSCLFAIISFFWHSIWHILWQDSDISSDFWLLTFYPIWHFITLFYHHRLIDLNHNISLHWQNLTSILTLTVWGWHSNSILFDWHSILSSYQIIFWHSLLVFFEAIKSPIVLVKCAWRLLQRGWRASWFFGPVPVASKSAWRFPSNAWESQSSNIDLILHILIRSHKFSHTQRCHQ